MNEIIDITIYHHLYPYFFSPIISLANNIHNITIYHQLAFLMFWIIRGQFQKKLKLKNLFDKKILC
jgi:hypothetical protein